MRQLCFFIAVLCLFATVVSADVNTAVYFPSAGFQSTVKTVETGTYNYISLAGCSNQHQPGMPVVPSKTIYMSIPANEEPSGIEATIASSDGYTAVNRIYPGQYPVAADGLTKSVVFAVPSAVYTVDANYPGTTAKVAHTGSLGGYGIANVTEALANNNC